MADSTTPKDRYYNGETAHKETEENKVRINNETFDGRVKAVQYDFDYIMSKIKDAVSRGENSIILVPLGQEEFDRYASANKLIPDEKLTQSLDRKVAANLIRQLGFRVSISNQPIMLTEDVTQTMEVISVSW